VPARLLPDAQSPRDARLIRPRFRLLEDLIPMPSARRLGAAVGLLAVAGTIAAIGVGPLFVTGADHLDAPLVNTDGRIDLTDIYAFRAGASRTALVLNVNPLTAPGSTKTATFRPGALYEFKIDTNGDARADIAYRVTFAKPTALSDGAMVQNYTVKRSTGPSADRHTWRGSTVAKGRTTAYGHVVKTADIAGGGHAFAGPRDDPFFFDLVGFKHLKERLLAGSTTVGSAGDNANCALADDDPGAKLLSCFTGTDTFAGTNISSIVLHVPNSMIGGTGHHIGIWATTSVPTPSGWKQLDRMARPAINTVFNISDGQKELTNISSPRDDRLEMLARTKTVLGAFDNVLEVNGAPNYSAAQIDAIAHVLLPDVLTYKVGDAHGFAYFAGNGTASLANLRLNGRRLADDVINAEFGLVTDFVITDDGVNANDSSFSTSFPYLAAPH